MLKVFHTDAKAITKAKSRLRVAGKALSELYLCKEYQEFSETWYTFLGAAKSVYTVLEQGAKASAQSRQWFGGVKQFRKDDELLQYLFEARNDEEHGLECSTEHVPGSLAIGVAKPGFSNKIVLNGTFGPGGKINVTSMEGKPVLIKQTLPHARLIAVNTRGGRTYDPPTSHRGQPVSDRSPANVAALGLVYLTELVGDAERRA